MQNKRSGFSARIFLGSLFIVVICLLSFSTLWAETAPVVLTVGTSTTIQTTTTLSLTSTTTVATALSPQNPGSFLAGNWKVDRAIFELFGNLKEVTGTDERFYSQIILGSANKGSITYGTKSETIDIEYDLKNNQSLTIAHGSRLKPLVDLYQILLLADGSIYLRSTRLSTVNATIYYLLRRAP